MLLKVVRGERRGVLVRVLDGSQIAVDAESHAKTGDWSSKLEVRCVESPLHPIPLSLNKLIAVLLGSRCRVNMRSRRR